MESMTCACCNKIVRKNPRLRQQKYCGDILCQKERKREWEKQKIRSDPDYQKNRKESQKKWLLQNPDYWKEYRKRNPNKANRNRLLQAVRNRRNQACERGVKDDIQHKIAKTDTLNSPQTKERSTFWLVPNIAKMDVLKVKVIEIIGYNHV